METNTPPRRTTRRADRYKQESGVAPSEALVRYSEPDAAPEGVVTGAQEAHHRRVIRASAQENQPVERPAEQTIRRTWSEAENMVEQRSDVQRPARETPPPAMARPQNAPQRKKAKRPAKKPGWVMPWWLVTALVVAFFAVVGLFTAQSLMSAWLKEQEDARVAAHQRVVDNHPLQYQALIEQYADENNLQPAFVAAIILNESSFRTDAESGVGARGLMQLMPATAEWIAGKMDDIQGYSFERMYDAETNIRFGTWYLGYLSKLFRGDPVLVSAAYHAGQGEVTRWLQDSSMSSDGVTLELENMIDGPTKTYAGRVTKAYGVYEALYYTPEQDATPVDGAAARLDADNGADAEG